MEEKTINKAPEFRIEDFNISANSPVHTQKPRNPKKGKNLARKMQKQKKQNKSNDHSVQEGAVQVSFGIQSVSQYSIIEVCSREF